MITNKLEITSVDGWVSVSEDPKDILIQLRTSDLLEVHAAEATVPGDGDAGILLHTRGSLEFASAGMDVGTTFYVRLVRAEEVATVVVMHNGTDVLSGGLPDAG
jgi:hypothetical protein